MTAETINKQYSRVIQAITAEIAAHGVVTRERFKAIMSEEGSNNGGILHGLNEPRNAPASTIGGVAE